MELNQGQKEAAEGFFNFLFSNERELIISGPGGTGKTFLMGYLIDTVLPRYEEMCEIVGISPKYHQVTMTATTNKAAEVLGASTRRPARTIHSYLNLRVKSDYQTGKTKLIRTNNWTVHQGQIIFVDEASMVDSPLLKNIHEGTANSKVIYVGDHCQLAPVMESLSPIYRSNLPFYELSQQMRNYRQPDLMEVCNQLRETVKTKEFHPIRIVPGVIDYVEHPRQLAQEYVNQGMDGRVLAYTNQRVVAYNDYIRALLNLPEKPMVGETVINNSGIQVQSMMMQAEDAFQILNIAPESEYFTVEPGTEIEVLRMDLRGVHNYFRNVPVPADREHFLALVDYYRKKKVWERYFFLVETFPDLRPSHAATVYKAQGSTYPTVYIDLDDISSCKNPDQAARLLYVAFSRAQNRIVLTGNLARRLGGLVC